MWIPVGIGLMVAVGLVAVALTRRSATSRGSGLSSEQWIALGIVFMGAGAATMSTLGYPMLGMMGVGVIFLARGLTARRDHSR